MCPKKGGLLFFLKGCQLELKQTPSPALQENLKVALETNNYIVIKINIIKAKVYNYFPSWILKIKEKI